MASANSNFPASIEDGPLFLKEVHPDLRSEDGSIIIIWRDGEVEQFGDARQAMSKYENARDRLFGFYDYRDVYRGGIEIDTVFCPIGEDRGKDNLRLLDGTVEQKTGPVFNAKFLISTGAACSVIASVPLTPIQGFLQHGIKVATGDYSPAKLAYCEIVLPGTSKVCLIAVYSPACPRNLLGLDFLEGKSLQMIGGKITISDE